MGWQWGWSDDERERKRKRKRSNPRSDFSTRGRRSLNEWTLKRNIFPGLRAARGFSSRAPVKGVAKRDRGEKGESETSGSWVFPANEIKWVRRKARLKTYSLCHFRATVKMPWVPARIFRGNIKTRRRHAEELQPPGQNEVSLGGVVVAERPTPLKRNS